MKIKIEFDRSMLFHFAGPFYSFTVYMVCVNSIVNPFVYVIQYHEFQNRTKEMFIICGREKQSRQPGTASVTTTDISIDTEVK